MRRLLLILVFFLYSPAWATTYYVSNAGSDSNPGTSIGQSWQTIGHVNIQTFSAGDIIQFKGGDTFNDAALAPPSSGSVGLPIIFQSYGTGKATLNPATANAVSCSSKAYITINNLTLTGGTSQTPLHAAGCTNFVASNNNLDGRILVDGAANVTLITGNTITFGASFVGNGIQVDSTAETALTITYNTINMSGSSNAGNTGIMTISVAAPDIEYNTITGSPTLASTQGIGIKASAKTVTAAVVAYNHISSILSTPSDGESIELTGNATYKVTASVHHNLCVMGSPASDCIGAVYTTNSYIWGNLVLGGGATYGIHISSSTVGTNYVYNNTLYNFASTGILIDNNCNSNTKNNIVHSGVGHGIVYAAGATGITDYNDIYNSGSNIPAQGSHSISTNPLFASATPATANDLKLQAGSPAIGTGTNLGTSYASMFDQVETSFPYRVATQPLWWTMGAFVQSSARYDAYHGSQLLACAGGAKGYFYTETISNRAWLCTPSGNVFHANMPYQINPVTTYSAAKYGDASVTWGPQQVIRMLSMGFNAIGFYSDDFVQPWTSNASWPGDHSQPQKVPSVYGVDATAYALVNLWSYCSQSAKDIIHANVYPSYSNKGGLDGHMQIDPFDPCTATWAHGFWHDAARDAVTAMASPYVAGVITGESDYIHLYDASPDFAHTYPNAYGDNFGVNMAAAVVGASPWQVTTYNAYSGGRVYYNSDRKLYAKTEWSNWLQASGTTAQTPTAAVRSGNVVTMTFASNVFAGSNASGTCIGDIITVTGMTPSSFNSTAGTGFCVQSSSGTQITYAQTGGDETATVFGTATLGPGYASIAALNTAWSAAPKIPAYSTFGSAGTNRTQTLSGSGSGPYTATLTFKPDMQSLWVKANGTVVGGAGSIEAETSIYGATITAGSINYGTNAVSVTFSGTPASPVTVDYYSGGYGNGSGLMDEDGNCPSTSGANCWFDDVIRVKAGYNTTGLNTDINNFLFHLAYQCIKIQRDELKEVYPNALFWGNNITGYWNTPTRKPVAVAQGLLQDVIILNLDDPAAISDYTDRMEYWLQYAGAKPMIHGWYSNANPDSSGNKANTHVGTDYLTQKARGTAYQTAHTTYWGIKGSNTNPNTSVRGFYPFVGGTVWAWKDSLENEYGAYGLVSWHDNLYNGTEACRVATTDAWGYPTIAEGNNGGPMEPLPIWEASHAFGATGRYSVAATVSGTVYIFAATSSGTSGGSAPSWCTTLNCTVSDNTVTWTNIGTRASETCYGDQATGLAAGNNYWWSQLGAGGAAGTASQGVTSSGVEFH